MKYFRLKDLDVKGKRVLVRVDFNVPLKAGKVKDNKRIKAALPTIRYILSKKPKQVILMSHLGRPKGKVVEELRIDPVAKELQRLLKKTDNDKIIFLENVQFSPGEIKNDENYAKKLAGYGDVFVMDAFGQAHRNYASIASVQKFIPSCAGFLLQKELETIGNVLKNPKKPFIAVIGGAKFDKIDAIRNLLKKVDKLLIGGALMFTFLKAKGFETGNSLVDNDNLELAKELMRNKKIILPVDAVVGDKLSENSESKNVKISEIKKGIGLDIGKKTLKEYVDIITKAKTVVWAGPMGKFEWMQYSKGSYLIAKAMTKCKGITIVGGGETAEIIERLKLEKKITLVSTGGGATLELLAGKTLPGVKALEDNYKKFRGKV